MKLTKRLSLYAICALSATTFMSCEKSDDSKPAPEFTLELKEGCFVTPASGTPGQLTKAKATFYKGNSTFVLDGWAPSAAMAAMVSDQIIFDGIKVSEENGKTTFTGTNLVTKSMFHGLTVTDIKGEIIGTQTMVQFKVHVAGMGGGKPSPYPTTYYGAITLETGKFEMPAPEFTLKLDKGCFVTPASGKKDVLKDAKATFFKGNNTLKLEGWSPSAAMAAMVTDDIIFDGLKVSEYNGKTTFTGTDLTTKSMFHGLTVTDVKGEIIGTEAMFQFKVHVAGMGGGKPSPYPTTYYGAITLETGKFEMPAPKFTLDLKEGCFVTPTSGTPGQLTKATAKFYKGNGTLVLDNWAPSAAMAAMASDDITITDLKASEYNGKITFSSKELVTKSMFTGSTVTAIKGEIIGDKAMIKLTVHIAGMGGGEPNPYPTTYYGTIELSDESFDFNAGDAK